MNAGSTSAQMIGTVLSDRYRLEAKLGSGGMSTVYLARDETLDRPVAVKVMHREMSEQADQLQRFRQEARAVAKISHPNVVAVIDAGEDRGHPYIVFEYVEGETLKQRIARVGALDVQEALAYSIEIARALALAHARQLVHRDIKPQNVLIDSEGRAKLTDFGISRQLEQAGMTATGRVLGTTDYVAPEQAMGHGADPRSDIYSLGVVLYEMLTGEVPFSADSQVGVAMKHVNEELPDVQRRRPGISAAAALVVERATFKAPERRYQHVDEMIADLETALEVEAARAGSTSGEATSVLDAVPPPRRRLARGFRWSWSGFALLLVAGGGGAGARLRDLQRLVRRRRGRRRRARRRGREPGQDQLGNRFRPQRRRRGALRRGRPRDRRQPDRDGLDHGELRAAGLRQGWSRPLSRRGRPRRGELAGVAYPRPGLEISRLRRQQPPARLAIGVDARQR